MPGWLKILLIVLGVLVLLAIAVVGAGVYWVSRNKDALMGRAKEVVTEGRDFGRANDSQKCLDEGISRYKSDPGFSSSLSATMFLRSCLDSTKQAPGFCDDVPGESEFRRTVQWRVERCERENLKGDTYCPPLFQQVQQYCAKNAR